MSEIKAWYYEGIDYSDAPKNLEELNTCSRVTIASKQELYATRKWEHLLQGKRSSSSPGWIPLQELASTRRGIATGSNSFFLISKTDQHRIGVRDQSVRPCIGRATDVKHLIFSAEDFATLMEQGGKTLLVDFKEDLSAAERAYVTQGEDAGLPERFLLANRRPWYSMEQREVAPIWAAVFGRGDLKFVYNSARVRSLTNFHCLYPMDSRDEFAKALTLCLNSSVVRNQSKLQSRTYGGGLAKFEPNDLKQIPVPDLRNLSEKTLNSLSSGLDDLDLAVRSADEQSKVNAWSRLDGLVIAAGKEAATLAPQKQLL